MTQSVCIIGGGIIGCSTAMELAAAGVRVTVVERGLLGGEASWAGAGLLTALLPWHYPQAAMCLLAQSRELYPEWVAGIHAESGIDPEYRVSGMLVLPPYDLSAASAWGQLNKEPLQELTAQTLEPMLASNASALWMPGVAQIRNPRLLRALREVLQRRGVIVRERTEITTWKMGARSVASVQTVAGDIQADHYLVAAGAWSAGLLSECVLPIKPMRGQIVLFKTDPGRLRRIVYCDGLYIIPREDGHILVGSTLEDVGFDKGITEAARFDLSRRARALLPFLEQTPVVGHWAGLRPGSPDNIPIMARHPALENLYLSSGHYRYGVTMAPASAQFMTNLILGRPNPIDATPYRWPS